MDKADISWLLVSTLLVLMMAVPGLALFYGGLVRSKNVLSVLLQVLCTFALGLLLWFAYGYSLAFTEGNAVFGGLSRTFFSGMFTPADGTYALSGTLTELLFASFQATFAGITCALIVGSFAERARFSRRAGVHGDLVHLCLYPDRAHGLVRLETAPGLLNARGAGFRRRHRGAHQCGGGRTGRRVRGGPTHRLWPRSDAAAQPADDLHRRGAAVGRLVRLQRRLVAGGQRRRPLAFFNTMIATAGAVLGWLFTEWAVKGKPSMLGAASGAVAGLVGITPAAGLVGPVGALVIGVTAGVVCVWGVNGLKRLLRADDALDVFGVHGVGGIVGALLTGVFNAKVLGGPGLDSAGAIAGQVWVQLEGVLLTIVWSAAVAWIAYKIADKLCGLRVPEDQEREGLDVTSHGESAYHS